MNYNEMKITMIEASDAYYNKTENIMSDAEFDKLKDQFAQNYPNDPFLDTIGAPPPENSAWEKVAHKIPMNSCNKVNTVDEFEKWAKDNGLADKSLIASEKLDGISLSLDFVDGKLVRATTRGDGKIGEDITSNALRFQNVKKELPIPYTGSLRGEVMMKHEDLDEINAIRRIHNEKPYENVRNASSGIARGYDGQFTQYLYIEYYYASGDFTKKTEVYDFIEKDLRLKSCTHTVGNLSQVENFYNEYEDRIREQLDHDIDGIVAEPNDISVLEKLGMKHGNYRGQIAWKFTNIKKQTIIKDVVFQLGDSGRLTPVVILEPVKIVGVTISRATLHNYDLFQELEPYKGAKCIISRRNDVIPYCESIEFPPKNSNPKYFKAPSHCPVCGQPTKIDGVYLICGNEDCIGGKIGDIKKWVKCLDLKGIGEGIIETLFNEGLIQEPSDLYSLRVEDIQGLVGFGKRSAEKIINIINSKTEVPLREFIGGINIAMFGRRMTDTLVEAGYDTLEKVISMTEKDLVAIKGIETITANALIDGLKKRKKIIDLLIKSGITIQKPKKKENKMKNKTSAMFEKSFVFTGKIERMDSDGNRYTREMLQDIVIENGGKTPSSVAKGVDYLVQADPSSQSTKTKKAISLGVEIISEEDFFKMAGI